MSDKGRHDHFELRRQSDDLVYSFHRMRHANGAVGYKRSDGEYWIVHHADDGWVAWDFESKSVMGRPWEVLPSQQGDHPPEGVWVSRKASKSYVYLLVYLSSPVPGMPYLEESMTQRSEEHLVVETTPDRNDVHFLEEAIYAFNVQATGVADGTLLAMFLRGPDDKVIGGAYGWTWGGTCYIRDLFVPENMRNQGHGTKIMRAIEEEAAARGCEQIVLETHAFQAPEFYRKLGFAVHGVVNDYPRGHQWLTMLKRLPPA